MQTIPDNILGFSAEEEKEILENYCCPVCFGDLKAILIPFTQESLISCPEHGNVEIIGRITKKTVIYDEERAYSQFHEVIRNLSDLWGELVEEGFDRAKALKIRKNYVCKICSAPIYAEMIPGSENVNLICTTHGNINQSGYKRKEE